MTFAVWDLIPNSWQTGPLNEVIMIGAVLAAVGVILKMAVLPVLRTIRRFLIAAETAADRLANVPVHDQRLDVMEAQISEIAEALRPTNGDRRSISDRLDTVKQQTLNNTAEILDLKESVAYLLERTP